MLKLIIITFELMLKLMYVIGNVNIYVNVYVHVIFLLMLMFMLNSKQKYI